MKKHALGFLWKVIILLIKTIMKKLKMKESKNQIKMNI